ncbi:MAG TPA: DUF4126 domain-containing protein [Candidatus Methylomirabilis sp.]|nr:DUF4126 domain-containing protein [Candidatus Methylomirabilis sp.]
MTTIHPLLGIPVGLALSTAAGLRVFVPLLLTGAAARLGTLKLTPEMAWIGSDAALVAFATATVLEIVAYYIPWLDNLLDTIATPAAVTAGIMITAAATPDLSPFLRWALAIVAGGGAAGLVQVGTALLRLKSSTFTAGAGNPLIATGELAGSIVLSVMGLLAPLLATVVVAVLLVVLASRVGRLSRARRRASRM